MRGQSRSLSGGQPWLTAAGPSLCATLATGEKRCDILFVMDCANIKAVVDRIEGVSDPAVQSQVNISQMIDLPRI
jgi:hypothetical protein